MTQTEVIGVIRDAVSTTLLTALPMLVIAIVVGLLVSIFQATTQIHEQTLAFVPKIVCILASLLLFGGYIMSNLTDFFYRHYESILTVLR